MATFFRVVLVVTGFSLLTSRIVAATVSDIPPRMWVSFAFYFLGTCLAVNQLVVDIKQSLSSTTNQAG